ncbi:myb-like DNA-binding domain-containing protein [Purpureocillium lavendulum]|uniref:Myb-like DNA-binding domain-containing protein n=1 Tax=Purpureocillium lavendulum TaxID=1247861 RepID=A0AB34FIE1_9HYPO|nr:myb-like DNA-binding domain-containing protein [Purpureocillium lavendulum]
MASQGSQGVDNAGGEKLRISMTNLILGRNPIVSGNRPDQRKKESAKPQAPADDPGGEADNIDETPSAAVQADRNGEETAPEGGDGTETGSVDASSCSHGNSSDACSDCKNDYSDCGEAEDNSEEGLASAEGADTSSTGGDNDQLQDASTSADNSMADVNSEVTGESSSMADSAPESGPEPAQQGATETDSAAEKGSSAPSDSGIESGGGHDSSGKDDNASTGISTPGADSSNEVASDQVIHKEASPGNTKDKGKGPAIDYGWSISEDHLLRGMKEGGTMTWVEIGRALNRGKNDVKWRWKILQKGDVANNPTTTDDNNTSPTNEPHSSITELSGVGKGAHGPGKAGKARATPSKGNCAGATSTDEAVDAANAAHGPRGKGKARATPLDHVGKWRKGKRNTKVASNKNAGSSFTAAAAAEYDESGEDADAEQEILSGEEASSEASIIVDDKDEDDEDYDANYYGWPHKNRHDIKYLHNEVYRDLYPNIIDPEPDEFFGEEDCAVLASVASKYTQSRFLEMQANFYNVTGRLVPLHLLRDKILRAEAEAAGLHYEPSTSLSPPAAAQSAVDEDAKRRNTVVEKWVQGVEEAGQSCEAGPAPKADFDDEDAAL